MMCLCKCANETFCAGSRAHTLGGADGIVPECFGSLVGDALQVAPPCRRCVLELFVAVVAVVFA